MPLRQQGNTKLERLLSPGSKAAARTDEDIESSIWQKSEKSAHAIRCVDKPSLKQAIPISLLIAAFLCFIAAATILLTGNSNSAKQKMELVLPILGALFFAMGIKPFISCKQLEPAHSNNADEPVMVWPRGLKHGLPAERTVDSRSEQEIFESFKNRLYESNGTSP